MAKKKKEKAPEDRPHDPATVEKKVEGSVPSSPPLAKSEKKPKEIKVKVGDVEFTGLCVSKRKTNSGDQVFLKIKGEVARWFNVEDIVK